MYDNDIDAPMEGLKLMTVIFTPVGTSPAGNSKIEKTNRKRFTSGANISKRGICPERCKQKRKQIMRRSGAAILLCHHIYRVAARA